MLNSRKFLPESGMAESDRGAEIRKNKLAWTEDRSFYTILTQGSPFLELLLPWFPQRGRICTRNRVNRIKKRPSKVSAAPPCWAPVEKPTRRGLGFLP